MEAFLACYLPHPEDYIFPVIVCISPHGKLLARSRTPAHGAHTHRTADPEGVRMNPTTVHVLFFWFLVFNGKHKDAPSTVFLIISLCFGPFDVFPDSQAGCKHTEGLLFSPRELKCRVHA